MRLLGGPFLDHERDGRGLGRGPGGRLRSPIVLRPPVDGAEELVVIDRTGRRDDQVARAVVRVVELVDPVAAHRLHGRGLAQDLASDGVTGEQTLEQKGLRAVVRCVEVHQDLLEDHLTLGFELVGAETRVERPPRPTATPPSRTRRRVPVGSTRCAPAP